MSDQRDEVAVHLAAAELGMSRRIGTLYRQRARGRTVIAFSYDPAWRRDKQFFSIDPAIGDWDGDQHFDDLPGVFADTAPDRWGRTLMERREALIARREGRKRRRLDQWDFLVGVSDGVRMGALRFASPDGIYLDASELTVPPATLLRELEHFAREAERGLPKKVSEEEQWIRMLIAPGSSLGGARPKASYLDENGELWIAKFPSQSDVYDVGAWEYVMSVLAARAGIAAPPSRLLRLGSAQHTFAVRRFDRLGSVNRRLYASAMTLTGHKDGDDASYLDIALAIRNYGDPQYLNTDLEELFRRLTFNVITANRDDHLRNHGFLRGSRGWRLSPVFDVNPSPEKGDHALAIAEGVHEGDLGLVRETAELYRVKDPARIIRSVQSGISGWRQLASESGIEPDEIDAVGSEFVSASD